MRYFKVRSLFNYTKIQKAFFCFLSVQNKKCPAWLNVVREATWLYIRLSLSATLQPFDYVLLIETQ